MVQAVRNHGNTRDVARLVEKHVLAARGFFLSAERDA
jgi:hypothetical protein